MLLIQNLSYFKNAILLIEKSIKRAIWKGMERFLVPPRVALVKIATGFAPEGRSLMLKIFATIFLTQLEKSATAMITVLYKGVLKQVSLLCFCALVFK